MSTTKEKVVFFGKTADLMSDFTKVIETAMEQMQVVAKDINVSTIYVAANKVGALSEYAINNFNKVCKSMIELLEVYEQNQDNVGEYKTLIRTTLDNVTCCVKPDAEFTPMNIEANGDEHVTPASINALNEALSAYSTKTYTLLMDISDVAGTMKSDDDGIVTNIGKSIESVTNQAIIYNKELKEAVSQFSQRYNVELSCLSDMSKAISGKLEELGQDSNIKASDYDC